MVVFLLIVIVCIMLFGKDEVKSTAVGIVGAILVLALFGMLLGSCGA